ncbi:methyltransferase domain-containing protein [Aggregicoccus sp. 17bor-14]|uniref:class I SAM-dependent methyltransferase n=1 Tax=Myxococcaceae TaxID=31 RepID=UPI00129C2F83|nr:MULTISPECIES: class I SAM-dependent methyltransferase [Myxococcaceae]MBF5041851.1 methyltransferase domain-containing protein [Simulacricoccus sp. 17bor-14]MRI87632.1 methyltransferase domain-containing protein [Aggregicoccus sp. 17bor-14]
MRLGLRADNLLERIAGWLNLAPQPLAQAFFGMMAARTLMAGSRLGVYRALAEGPAHPDALAVRLGLSAAGTRALLEALRACEAVQLRRGGLYRLAPRAERWLDPHSPTYVGGYLDFNYAQWDWWGGLEEVVRSGKGVDIHRLAPEDPRWSDYIHGLHQLARLAAPEVARALPLPRAPGGRAVQGHVLDLGGGHGWFAAELLRRHPGLGATVLDLPGSARVGREIVAAAGLSARMAFREVDLLDPATALTGPAGEAPGLVLLFQVLHHLSREQGVALLVRVRRALAPGGRLAVLEYLREGAGEQAADGGEDASSLVGLHFFLTSGAAAWTLGQLRSQLEEAGFRVERVRPVRRLPLQSLVVASPDDRRG